MLSGPGELYHVPRACTDTAERSEQLFPGWAESSTPDFGLSGPELLRELFYELYSMSQCIFYSFMSCITIGGIVPKNPPLPVALAAKEGTRAYMLLAREMINSKRKRQ